jgi:hypothetical protein
MRRRYFIISSGGIGPHRFAASGVFGHVFGRCGLSRCQGKTVTIPAVTVLERNGDLVKSLRIYLDVGPVYA